MRGVCVFDRRPLSDIREIRAHPHFAEKRGAIEQIVPRRAAAFAPFPIDVGSGVIGADLLGVTIDTAVRDIDATAAFRHAGLWRWINIGTLFVHLRIEMTDLQIRNQNQTRPRECERAEDPEEKSFYPFHTRASSASSSFGFKKVGTLAVRPRPKSIKPK